MTELLQRSRSSRSDGDFSIVTSRTEQQIPPILIDFRGSRRCTRGSLPALLPDDLCSSDRSCDSHLRQRRHPCDDVDDCQLHKRHHAQLGEHPDGQDQHPASGGGRLTRRELREMQRHRIAAAKFSKSIRLVVIMVTWIRVMLKRKNYQEDESVKVVDTLKGFTIENSDLTFDPSYFRAKREIDLTGEMKAILQLEPQARTTEQVQTVMYGLQTLPTFNEYPLRTQEKLARVAFYQSVPPGRLIIRQGHIGVNFYIIIRGRVIVSVMQEDRRTGDTRTNIVARLGQGQSFGEVALLRQVARTASVVSQDATQLLAIGREEFNEIFTKPEPGRLLPGHVEFLAGCGFMRSFPLERLSQQPSACLLTFFRRNALIAPDSKAHPHLVVVRSGSCRVVKNLELSADSLNGAAEDEEAAGAAERSGVSFGKDVGRSEPKVDTWRRRPQAFAASLTVGSKHHQGQVSPRYWQPQPVQLQVSRHEHHGAATVLEVSRPGHHPHQLQALMEAEELPERPKLRRRLAMNAGEKSGAEKTVVAVQVSTLKPGDVFGLSDVIFKGESNPEIEASASVALVSNGAECVLLSKAFFVQHATEQVRRDVRELARPYPEEAVFEDNYRCQVAWDKYRRRLFRDTLRRIDAARGGDK